MIFLTFSFRILLHLVRQFQKGWGHGVILHMGRAVGGCGRGRVPELVTPSVIPFWNRLTKCNNILKEKVKKIIIGKIFFWILLVRVRKVIWQM